MKLQQIKNIVNEELNEFNVFFKRILKTDNTLLNYLLKYLFRGKGKQIRPLLVFLSARISGNVSEKTYVAASLIELLHTATLVHDDVVDRSEIRRSLFSIQALWKSKVAVLVGDYLLSQGLLLSVRYKTYDILETVSEAVQDMSEGELLQLEKARKLNFSVDSYLEIIGKKTASLIKASTKAGALSATDDEKIVNVMAEVGWNIGMAFQIKDDMFDYENTSVIGKPGGNDIQEGKITLPVIYAYNNLEKKQRREFLKKLSSKNKTNKDVSSIKEFIQLTDALSLTNKDMFFYINNAKQLIEKNFERNTVTQALIDLIDFVVNRKK